MHEDGFQYKPKPPLLSAGTQMSLGKRHGQGRREGVQARQLTERGSGGLCLLAPLFRQRVQIINILIRGVMVL